MLRYLAVVAAAGLALAVHAKENATPVGAKTIADSREESSDDNLASKKYRPPIGFGGYLWNAPLADFRRLAPEPVYVRIAHTDGHTSDLDFDCLEGGAPVDVCSKTEGAGWHAMAEYYVDSQGFRLTDAAHQVKVVLFPISYQFCSQWEGFSSNIRGDVMQNMRLCGVRLLFRSETALQEQTIRDPDYLTTAQRILDWLIESHGEPEHFAKRGTVIVGTAEQQREISARKSRYDNWYWCSAKVDDMMPTCSASIVFTFDSETGRGQVILLTPNVWAYAYARRYGGSENDPLFKVLHGNIEGAPVRHICTGTYLCQPQKPKPMSEKMMARFRLPTNETN